MCNRVTLQAPPEDIIQSLGLSNMPEWLPRFNIAPTQQLLIFRRLPGRPAEGALVQWGLLPAWAAAEPSGAAMFNARAETAHQRPAFREAFRQRRCLIPVDGFYEWRKEGRKKLPYWISLQNKRPFALAGLWESCELPKGEVETCTIITVPSNELVRPLHERMPAILAPAHYESWIAPELSEVNQIQPMLRPYPAEQMISTPVSTYVNNSNNEGAQCLAPPAPEPKTLFD